jgi:uncharacterized repeat protein (TIGR01451 family)
MRRFFVLALSPAAQQSLKNAIKAVEAIGDLEKLELFVHPTFLFLLDLPFGLAERWPEIMEPDGRYHYIHLDKPGPTIIPTIPKIKKKIKDILSRDPNALVGPGGFGTQNYVQAGASLPYTIDFENDGSAAAQDVTVTEQLDASLDWSTFQLGSFGFGSVKLVIPVGLTQYQTTVAYRNSDGSPLYVKVALDFHVQTGLLTVTFLSVDPATGLAPAGAFDGFLPPDDASHEGECLVQYTVSAKPQAATGTTINQQASVVFDTNAAISTNSVTNTIDSSAPTSHVNPLASFSPASFTVSWTGQGDPVIAIIATSGIGTWQYLTNGKTWVSIAAVSPSNALLLPRADRLRFLPAGLGTAPATLFFDAWNGLVGAAHHYVTLGTTGGSSFSAGELDVTLTPIAQAPVWLAHSTTLTPVPPVVVTNPAGETVQQAFATVFSGDHGQAPGVAIVGLTGTSVGTWEYDVYSDGSYLGWRAIPTNITARTALLLSGQDLIGFVPKNNGVFGSTTMLVHAWDQSSGSDGGSVNLKRTGTGGKTAFSGSILTTRLYANQVPM